MARGLFIALCALCLLAGCASGPPRYRDQAVRTLERVQGESAETLLPQEFKSAMEALTRADLLLKEGEHEEAERFYQLTLLKGNLLEEEVRQQKERKKEAERLAEEQRQAELERQAQEEADRLAQAKLAEEEQKESAEVPKKAKPVREHPLISSYTVRRGESLPFISSQPEVYGDRNLWPLIYRANRDQISDPRHIWPGQVLRIPRNTGREEIVEARRYAQERPLH